MDILFLVVGTSASDSSHI